MLHTIFRNIFRPSICLCFLLLVAWTSFSYAEISLFGGVGFGSSAPGSYATLGFPLGIRAESKKTIFLFSELAYFYIHTGNSTTVPTHDDSYEEYTYKETSNNLTLSGGAGIRIGSVSLYTAPLLFIPLSHNKEETSSFDDAITKSALSIPKTPLLSVFGGIRIKVYDHLTIDIRQIGRTPQNNGLSCLLFGYRF